MKKSAIDPAQPPVSRCICKGPTSGILLSRRLWLAALGSVGALPLLAQIAAPPDNGDSVRDRNAASMAARFERDVAPRLSMPHDEAVAYADRLNDAFEKALLTVFVPQFVVLIDRSPQVQAALLYVGAGREWTLIGATPVSTGLPGRYEHFTTPLGVFDHSMANPDFRAEGTKNKRGFRGYGRKGLRVYDFGWVKAPRGWGDGRMGVLRLQMHSTDPDFAESKLGSAQSEGCVRIPAALNAFIDQHALIDADYDRAVAEGQRLWVLRADRTPTAFPGRYLVVIDSHRTERPPWSPAPAKL